MWKGAFAGEQDAISSAGGWFLFLTVDLLLVTEERLTTAQACLRTEWDKLVWSCSRPADSSSWCGLGVASKYVNQAPSP